MRTTLLWMTLLVVAVAPAQGAKFDAGGTDLSKVALSGVTLGDSLSVVMEHWPDAKVARFRDPKQISVITGGRAVKTVTDDVGERMLIAHLTHDNRVYSIEIREAISDEQFDHPAKLIEQWIDRYGLPSKDYEIVSDNGRTYLTWFDLPRRQMLMSIALQYEKQGECESLKPGNVDCAKYQWVYGDFETTYILKDRELEIDHRRTVEKILRRKSSRPKGKKKSR